MIIAEHISTKTIWELLKEVPDPELPVLSIVDLGIVREVRISNNELEVILTPTYSGCPAMEMIRLDIRLKLSEHGLKNIKITEILSPAWTTDWITDEAKQKLKEYGIAPPDKQNEIHCPMCNSVNVKMISQFGSTACKALYQCNDCKEPFDYFKCH
jgi:ring-1,2-phenylacetyl-CoA epoxidase subunit PaaD